MKLNKFESHSGVTFAVGNTAMFGIEPSVMSSSGGSWYRCVCYDGYGVKNTLNVCAASNEEADLLVKLAAVMFGIVPASIPYLISGWSAYLDMLVPTDQPEGQIQDDYSADSTDNEEQQH